MQQKCSNELLAKNALLRKKFATELQAEFHETSIQLTAELLQTMQKMTNPTEVLRKDCFRKFVHHLNPVAELPTETEVVNRLTRMWDPRSTAYLQPPCIVCGEQVSSKASMGLGEPDALLFLTAYVLAEQKTMQNAKKEAISGPMTSCRRHKKEVISFLMSTLGITILGEQQIGTALDALPDNLPGFRAGCHTYNTLKRFRQMYKDEPQSETCLNAYIRMLRIWLVKNYPMKNPNPIVTRLRQHHPRAPADHASTSSSSSYSSAAAAAHALLVEPDEQHTTTPLKRPKLEEPDEEPDDVEETASSSHHAPPLHPPSPPPVRRTRPRIYTLADGRKVVKAPPNISLLAKRAPGKLVTIRVVSKKRAPTTTATTTSEDDERPPSAASAPAVTATALIRRVDYNPFQEQKPDVLGQIVGGVGAASSSSTSSSSVLHHHRVADSPTAALL